MSSSRCFTVSTGVFATVLAFALLVSSVAAQGTPASQAGVATSTHESNLVLTRSVLHGFRFSTPSAPEPLPVYRFGVTLSSDFIEVVGAHPEALELAQESQHWAALSTIGTWGLVAYSGKVLLESIQATQTLDRGRIPDTGFSSSDLVWLASTGVVAIVGGVLAKRHLEASVARFNELSGARPMTDREPDARSAVSPTSWQPVLGLRLDEAPGIVLGLTLSR